MKSIVGTFLGGFLAVTSVVIAADAATDPVIGTWKLDVAKSKFSGPAQKSSTRTYEQSADGSINVTVKSVGADGKASTLVRTFKADGKEYPIKDSSGPDSITEKQISTHTAEYVEKKAGKVTVSARRTVSKDGKTLTVHEKGTDADGTKLDDTLVFEKQ